jgi:hypothetical protein
MPKVYIPSINRTVTVLHRNQYQHGFMKDKKLTLEDTVLRPLPQKVFNNKAFGQKYTNAVTYH